jgi:hypothetical protein
VIAPADAAPALDAAPVARDLPPDAPTVVLGAMGGTAVQHTAQATLAKIAPNVRVVIDGTDAARGLADGHAWFLDASDLESKATPGKVTCKLKLLWGEYPSRRILASLSTGASVTTGTSASDLDAAVTDCAEAATEDTITKRIVEFLPTPPKPGADLKAVVRAAGPRFQACYDAALAAKPTLEGTVDTTFVISPDGSVQNAHSTGLDPQVAKCVEDVFFTLRFAPWTGSGTLMTTYPLVFTLPKPKDAPKKPVPVDGLTQAQLERTIGKNEAALHVCYDRALKTNPELAGKARIQVEIAATGAVTAAHATGFDDVVDACLERVMKTVVFPKSDRPTTAYIPVSFSKVSAAPACDPKTAERARDAVANGDYARALALCEQALACNANDKMAGVMCAVASCNLKDCARAKKYVGALSGTRQSLARQSCLRNGLDPAGC